MPTLQEIYNYIFRNDWADPASGLPATLAPQAKAQQIKTRTEKMRALFNEEIIPLAQRNKFRAALRAANASHLETALFGNTKNKLKEKYTLPDDYKSVLAFFENRNHFFYAVENKEAESAEQLKALEKFSAFLPICQIVADFIEQNNTEDNAVARLHAYKMLIIFGDQNKPDNYFKSIDLYLKKHNYLKLEHPLHDALIWDKPDNSPTLYLTQWRKIIHETGSKAFQLFQRASVIGEKLGAAPKSYLEALKIARTLTYKRSAENPELADLCMHYHLSDASFEKALETAQKEKKSDNLPTVVVRGDDINVPRYYLIKLPIGDPRAFVLGQLTNCCQYIGGNSEECVIDGITRPNNGFLILLKERFRSTENKDEKNLPRRRLTESDFNITELFSRCKIMGQGYVWLSNLGNLTIDSWENLNPNVENAISVLMLHQYANDVIEQENSHIMRVTIGEGGNTPSQFKNNIIFPEKMLEGTQYGDSENQRLIAYNEKYREELQEQIKLTFPDMNDKTLAKLTPTNVNYFFGMKSILKIEPLLDYLKKDDHLKKFVTSISTISWSYLNIFGVLEEAKLCTTKNITETFSLDDATSKHLNSILLSLKKADLLNQENLSFFFSSDYRSQNERNAQSLSHILEKLANLNLLNAATFNAIRSNLAEASTYDSAIIHLQNCKTPFRTQTILFLRYYATDSSAALKILAELLENPPPDIYQHLKEVCNPGVNGATKSLEENKSETINFSAILMQNKKTNFDLIMDAASILITLLSKPADINYGAVLTLSIRNGNLPILQTLLKQMPAEIKLNAIFTQEPYKDFLLGNTFYKRSARSYVPDKTLEDNTLLLLCAASHGHTNIVDFFMPSGANINEALCLAVRDQQTNTVELLLEKKANPNYALFFYSEKSILFYAVHDDDTRMVKLLLEARADVNSHPTDDIFHWANQRCNPDVIRMLIENKLDVNEPNERQHGNTPLMDAVSVFHKIEVVSLLIDAKANVNAKATKEDRPSVLHCATCSNNPVIIKLLVERSANINATNKQNKTPLQKAVESRHTQSAKTLLQLGAKSDLTDYADVTRSQLYKSCTTDKMRKILKEFHADYMKTHTAPPSFLSSVISTLFYPFSKTETPPTPTQEVKDKKTPDAKT